MDVGLPTIDGLEATRRLLTIKPGTRVIVLTGETPDEGRHAAFDAGAVNFLTEGGIHDQVREAIFRAMARTASRPTTADAAPAPPTEPREVESALAGTGSREGSWRASGYPMGAKLRLCESV